MKKVKKGILFYIGILFGVLLAAFVVCVLIMVFSPGTSILGLRYYNENQSKMYDDMEIFKKVETEDGVSYEYVEQKRIGDETYPVSTIKVNTNAHDVTIVKANKNDKNYTTFFATFENKTTGFIAKDYLPSKMSVNYYTDSKTLEFFAEIPIGFLPTGNSSSVYIQIPESFDTENLNLVVENQEGERSGGRVVIGDSKSSSNLEPNLLPFKSATIKATKGLTITDYAKIGTTLNRGDIVLDVKGGITVDSQLIAKNLTIKSENGKDKYANENGLAFSVSEKVTIETKSVDSTYGTITANVIVLQNTYGKQNFSTVSSNLFSITGDSKKCDYNFENLTIEGGDGTLVVGQEKTEVLEEKKADKCNIKIKNLNGVRKCLTTGKVEVENQDFQTQVINVEMAGDETSRTGKLIFNDRIYNLSAVVGENNAITYSIVLDDQNKIIKTTSSFTGEIDGIKFTVTSGETWIIEITVAE